MGNNLPTQVPSPNTTPASTELIYLVSNPYGSPADDAATAANIVTKAHGLSDTTVLGISSGVIGATSTSGTGNVVRVTSATLVTPTLGAASATSVNGLTITSSTGTFTLTNAKTLTVDNTLELAGTDSTKMTFPSTSATIARTDAANTFTGHQTIEGVTTTGATGTGSLVFATSPTLITAVLGSSTATTQSALDNSTKLATTAYTDGAVATETTRAETAEALLAPLASPTFTGTVTVPTTTNSTDAAQKAYVDAAIQGLSIKDSVVATTTGSETFTILAGNVTVITGTTIDGQSPSNGDRILIKDAPASTGAGSANSTQPGNGIYTIVSNITNLTVSRATDMSGSNAPQGAFTFVEGGTANVSSGWVVSVPNTDGSFTYGTNNIKWAQFSGAGEISAGTGLAKSGNTLSIENSGVLLASHGGTGLSSLGTGVATLLGGTPSGTVGIAGTTSPSFTTPTLGVASATTVNKLTITAPASGATLTIVDGKTLTANNSLTLAGTDATTMTFPSTSASVARTDAAQTFTGTQSGTSFNETNVAVTVSSNAGTCAVANGLNTFTNSSAATMAITIATSGAVDGQLMIVRIYDYSAVAQTIGWTNTENSTVFAPTTSNGSTTLPLTVGFMYNGSTSKWRCIALA